MTVGSVDKPEKWESVYTGEKYFETKRLKVPNGWLYRVFYYPLITTTFVPEHVAHQSICPDQPWYKS
jgi:hypothetical protein